jgi:hypothetical protein
MTKPAIEGAKLQGQKVVKDQDLALLVALSLNWIVCRLRWRCLRGEWSISI